MVVEEFGSEHWYPRFIKEPFRTIVRLAVGNIDYPPVVSQAVEKKLAAKQLLEEKETQREIAQRTMANEGSFLAEPSLDGRGNQG